MRRILAIGGFSTGESEAIAAGYIRDLTGKTRPRVCLLSTPSGDAPWLIHNFDDLYGKLGCETSNVRAEVPPHPAQSGVQRQTFR
ncbi:hypothetical protein E1956_26845 [Paraburkholderia pallida]|uniref:Uncharacterized protein n=1 Tax=Paraburkholderia pallida TaxID=2547399 RepID=A0A4P7D137_9BURK|nr:hypothetical protein E1956_26845 [Paraburkholderia pallida]